MPPDVAERARRWLNASSRMRNFDTAVDGINNGTLDLDKAGGWMDPQSNHENRQGRPDPRTFDNNWSNFYCQLCPGFCQVCGRIVGETNYPLPGHAETCPHEKPRTIIERPGGACCQPPPHRYQSYDQHLPSIGQGEYFYGNNYFPEPETWHNGPPQPVYNVAMQAPPAPPFSMPQFGRANTLPSGPVHHDKPYEPTRMHTIDQASINGYQPSGYYADQQQGMVEQQGSQPSLDAGPTAFPRCTLPDCTAFLRSDRLACLNHHPQ